MKKKALLVVLATMTLTVASVGTAFAYEDNGDVASQSETEEHTHTWGEDTWVKTADAVYEQVKVVDKEAVYSEPEWVWDKWPVVELHWLCYCGYDFTANHDPSRDINEEIREHQDLDTDNDTCWGHRQDDVVVEEGVGHWTESTLISPEEFHYENGALITPEQGYWTHTCTVCGEIQNRDTGEVIQQGALSGQPTEPVVPNDPNTPQDTPGNNVTDDPNTPQTTPDNSPNTEANATEPSTSQEQGSNNTTTGNTTGAAAVNTSQSKKSPKTGDGTGAMSLLTLVGGALTGGTALAFRKRLAK